MLVDVGSFFCVNMWDDFGKQYEPVGAAIHSLQPHDPEYTHMMIMDSRQIEAQIKLSSDEEEDLTMATKGVFESYYCNILQPSAVNMI